MSRESWARAPAAASTATRWAAWIAGAASRRCGPWCTRSRAWTGWPGSARPRRSSTGSGWPAQAAHPPRKTSDGAAGRPARPGPAGTEASLLARALAELPPTLRTAIVLRDVEGLSTQEAAEIAGVSQAAFKSRLHQARLRVRAAIGDEALVTSGG